MKIKSFKCPKSIKSIKRNNAWIIRLLVDDSFVPSSKQPSIIYCRLTNFTAVCTVFGHWNSTSCQIATIIGCFGGTSLGNPVTNSSTKSQFISEWGVFLVKFLYIYLH